MEASIDVSRTIKGTIASAATVRFLLPLRYSIGYRGVSDSGFNVFFLKQDGSAYGLASPYYPNLPALPNAPSQDGDVLSSVIAEVANVIASSSADWSARRDAMFYLHRVSGEIISDSLRVAAANEDSRVNAYAAAFLLLRNDASGLPLAIKLLSSPDHYKLRIDDRSNLLAGIDHGLHSSSAFDDVQPLLQSQDGEVRSAAAGAIGNSGSPLAYNTLVSLFQDSDSMVRYSAARALANLTADRDWQPQDFQHFTQNERRYIEHWKTRPQ